MSNKFHIDEIFREVADKHEETYQPENWAEMQGFMANKGFAVEGGSAGNFFQGLARNILNKTAQYVSKGFVIATTAILLPSSQQIELTMPNPSNNPSAYMSQKIQQAENKENKETIQLNAPAKSAEEHTTPQEEVAVEGKVQVVKAKNIDANQNKVKNTPNKTLATDKTQKTSKKQTENEKTDQNANPTTSREIKKPNTPSNAHKDSALEQEKVVDYNTTVPKALDTPAQEQTKKKKKLADILGFGKKNKASKNKTSKTNRKKAKTPKENTKKENGQKNKGETENDYQYLFKKKKK